MKQTRTTLKELTAAYRAVLRHGILCNAIALGLIAAPAMADNSPNTSAVNPAWVFGDITLADAPVGMATIGGRRINNWNGTKYQNDIPQYHMVGQSLSVTNSDMYVGPVSLKLREIDAANDTFAYNYQWDTDGDEINNDVDLANWAGVGWNEEYATIDEVPGVYAKVAAKINGDPNAEGYYDNAGDTAPGVYMFSRLDTEHTNAGAMSFRGSTVTTNGTTVNADSISVTDGSTITVVNEDTLSLTAFNGGNIDTTGVTTLNADTMNIDGSRMVVASGAELTINPTTSATFTNMSSDANGGAIYNNGTLTLNGNTEFSNNTSGNGAGAIYNEGNLTLNGVRDGDNYSINLNNNTANGIYSGSNKIGGGAIFANRADSLTTIEGTKFSQNHANSAIGGAMYLFSGTAEITNSEFSENTAAYGGAIYTQARINNVLNTSDLTITNSEFNSNTAKGTGALGIMRKGIITDTDFTGNQATDATDDGAGALFLGAESYTTLTRGKFEDNTSAAAGGAIGTRDFVQGNNVAAKLDINGTTFNHNTAATTGGAIDNYFYNDAAGDGYVKVTNATFTENEAANGGAIYNHKNATQTGKMYIADTQFNDNTASGKGGAIYNEGELTLAITAGGQNIAFYDNTANGQANDIYNSGVLNLDVAAGKLLALNGGVDGENGTLNINGAGTVNMINSMYNQTVNLNNGEMHLTVGVDGQTPEQRMTGSTVNVADGATINTIDYVVSDFSDSIKLANGAGIKGDIDYENGEADLYGAADDTTSVTYKMANALGADVQYGAQKAIQVVNGNVTVNKDASFGFYNSDKGLTLASSGEADGKILVTGKTGGIESAADDSANVNEITYDLTADESLGTSKSIQHTFVLNGDGTESTDGGLELAGADLTIADGATVEINNLKLNGNGTLNNAATGVLAINDSLIGVNVRNAGILYSDPTTYSGTLTNTGVANIDGDTFASTGVLENYGAANLTGATFDTGAEITGSGVTNLVSGTTAFNSTSNANTVHVASGANFTGALVGGTLDLHNGTIETGTSAISGSFSGGNVVLDAKFAATDTATDSTIDTIGTNSGTIKEINILGTAYGDADEVSLAIGGATLDPNVQINGMNYFTKVEKNGTDLKFSDKLINESGLYTKLGAWTGGNYIKANADFDNPADADHLTVGQALSALDTGIGAKIASDGNYIKASTTNSVNQNISALDTQLKTVSTAGTIASGQTGFVTGDAVHTALSDKQDNLTTAQLAAANSGITSTKVSGYDAHIADTDSHVSASDRTTWNAKQDAIADLSDIRTNATAGAGAATTIATYGNVVTHNVAEFATAAQGTKAETAIQGVQVNGAALTPNTDNIVNVTVTTGTANGTIKVNGADVAVAGLNSAAYEAATAFDAAGSAAAVDAKLGTGFSSTDTVAAALALKQDAISNTATIAADGTGFSVVAGSIGTTQLSAAVNTSLGLADSAVQSVTTGTTNGTIKVDGTEVAVAGLGTAAYTASTAYATAAQGAKADSAVQSVTTGTTNGTIKVDGTEVAVAGLGSAAYEAATAFDAAGSAAAVDAKLGTGFSSTDTVAAALALKADSADLGTAAGKDVAGTFTGSTEADIAAWGLANTGTIADVDTTFAVLTAKLGNVENDLLNGTGSNAHSIAHALGASGSTTLTEQVQTLADIQITANAAGATYNASGTYADNTIGKAIQGKQAAITDTSTIAADGTGFSVVDGSIGTTQLSTAVNASLGAADSAIQGVKVNGNALTPDSSKYVDVTVTSGTAAGTISVNGADVAVTGFVETANAGALSADIATIMGGSGAAKDKRTALAGLLTTGTYADQNLTSASTAEAVASYMQLTADVMSEYDFGWDLNVGLLHDKVGGKYKIDVLNDTGVTDITVAGAINANTAAMTVASDGNYITAGHDVAANLGALDTQAKANADDIDALETATTVTADGNYILAANDVKDNLGALDAGIGAKIAADGNYIKASSTNSVNQNISALDTQAKANADGIADIVSGATIVAKAYGDEDGNNIKATYATKTEVTTGVTAVYNQAHDWAENLLGLDVDEGVGNQLQHGLAALGGTNNIDATTITGALHELDTEKAGLDLDNTFTGENTFQNANGINIANAGGTIIANMQAGTYDGHDVLAISGVDGVTAGAFVATGDGFMTEHFTANDTEIELTNSSDAVMFSVDDSGDMTVAGNASVGGDLDVTGGISAATLATTSDATIGGDLAVTGATTLTGLLTANGGITTTTLATSGNVTLGDAAEDTVTVNGTATFAEQINATKGIKAGTNTTLVDGTLTVSDGTDTSTLTKNTLTTTTVNATTVNAGANGTKLADNSLVLNDGTNASTLSATADGLNINTGAKVNGILAVTSDASVGGNLGVTGNTTMTGNLTANGNVTLGDAAEDTVTVNGTATFAEQINATNGIKAGTNTTLTDNSLALSDGTNASTLSATADGLNINTGAKVGGNLVTTGDATVGVNLKFAGAPTVTVSAIDDGTTAQTTGGANTLSTVATVLKSAENAAFTGTQVNGATGAITINGALSATNAAIGDMNGLTGKYVTPGATIAANLDQLSNAIDGAYTYTDQRVESLDKEMSAGVAGAVALSSVAVSGVERGEVSVGAGYGYFNGQSAAAFGAAMGLTNNWSVNAGAGISNADVSFRAGTNYKFKLF